MMRQYYYTSTGKGTSGSAGFQCKAKSSGLTAEDVNVINTMVGYRIPPMLDETKLHVHPPALRYVYLSQDKCVLVNSQSNGPDENGRPGNFFGHAVLTKPEDFKIYPPIMFWRNQFWKSDDPSDRTTLPELNAFNVEPSLDFDQVWNFLNGNNRREWLRSLLAAVIRHDTEKRPIVILDHVDNIAKWIAAVTFALPGHYRPFISFATYHHDPYQVPYRITGTTSDSKFRFSADEYISYFLLNAEANRISDVGDSRYANFVAENFTPELYDEKLLDLFALCSARLPPRPLKNLDSALDAVTSFFLTFREGRISPTVNEAKESLASFMAYIEDKSSLGPDDIEEVSIVADTLLRSLPEDNSSLSLQTYGRVLNVLNRNDRGFNNRCPQDLLAWLITLKQDAAVADQHLQVLESVYGTALSNCAAQGEFPEQLSTTLRNLPWKAHQLVWDRVIPMVSGRSENKRSIENILGHTLYVGNQLALPGSNEPRPEALTLLGSVIESPRLSKSFLLGAAADWYRRTNGVAFFWFYYELIRAMPLSERTVFRKDVQRVIPDITLYEVQQDAKNCRIEDMGSKLLEWSTHLDGDPSMHKQVINTWLDTRWKAASMEERKQIADQILYNDELSSRLEPAMKTQLLDSFMAGLNLKRLSPNLVKLYEKYRQYDGLSSSQQAIINGSLAITQGTFPEKSVSSIQKWLNGSDNSRYRTEVIKFMDAFFSKNVHISEHANMLDAVYSERHKSAFWEAYWGHFRTLISDNQRIKQSADLLTYWFEQSALQLQNCKYLVAAFFLELPLILEEASDEKSSQRSVRALSEYLSQKEWYPLIEEYFIQRRGGIRGIFSRQ